MRKEHFGSVENMLDFKTAGSSLLSGTTSSSLNSDQTKQGWLHCGPGTVAGAYSCNARPASQLSQPQDTVTPILGGFFFFLRHCSSDFRKPSHKKIHQSNKKRHKLASSDGFEKLQLTPRLTFLFCPVSFFL